MQEYLAEFQQSKIRKWVWIVLMIANAANVVLFIALGAYSKAISEFFIVCIVFWVYHLERYVSNLNKVENAKPNIDA